MARIYLPPQAFGEECITLRGESLRRVRTVLRLRAGDRLTVTDGRGAEYLVCLEGGRDEVRASILERAEPRRESPLRTILAQAVPKGERFPFVLQKAVEMGVTEIVPVVTRRTVVAARAGSGRAVRWRKIVEEAVGQSGRTILPLVHEPRSWEEAASLAADVKVLLFEEGRRGLRELLDAQGRFRSALVAVGPEGGWMGEEVRLAEDAGFHAVRIGPRILRTETVGLAALAIVQYVAGDLGGDERR